MSSGGLEKAHQKGGAACQRNGRVVTIQPQQHRFKALIRELAEEGETLSQQSGAVGGNSRTAACTEAHSTHSFSMLAKTIGDPPRLK